MEKNEFIKQCRYYKGEEENPFDNAIHFGKWQWWNLEYYSFKNGDIKEKDKLSKIMLEYIREWHWEPEMPPKSNTWEVAIERATELYLIGKFNGGYISHKAGASIPFEKMD